MVFYRDIDLAPPGNVEQNDVEKKEKELDGTKKVGKQDTMYTLLECHVNLDLEGFEEVGADGQPTGVKLPYIVTVEEGSRLVLSIRRNYAPDDLKKNKIQYFVHFKFSARTWILWLWTHSHDWRIEQNGNVCSPSITRCGNIIKLASRI
jgi:hypothetical protein